MSLSIVDKSERPFPFISSNPITTLSIGSSRKNHVPNLVIYDKLPALQCFYHLAVKARQVNKEFRKHSFLIYLKQNRSLPYR